MRRARRRRGGPRVEEQPVKTFELDINVEVEEESDSIFGEADITAALDALRERQSVPSPARASLSPFSPFATPSKPPERSAPPTRATFGRPRSSAPPTPEALPERLVAATITSRPTAKPSAPTKPPALPPAATKRPAPPIPPAATKRPAPPAAASKPTAPRPSAPKRPARPKRPPATSEPRPAAADPMKKLYDDYVTARQRNNEPVDSLKYEKLAASVSKMKTKLRAKHGKKDIDFEVVVRNGRVGLKPKIGS